jgi:predicted dehydrogenase
VAPTADLVQIEQWRTEYRLGAPVGARAETWASYRESADGSWYDDPARCPVAPVLRLGVYLINDLVRIFGPASTVQVVESRLFTHRPTADNALLSIGFENGALAAVSASFCVGDGQRYPDALVLNFERGTIRRTTERAPHTKPDTKLSLTIAGHDGQPERRYAAVDQVSGDYRWEAFAHAVRGGPDADNDGHILDGVRVLAAMARASRSGATERVCDRRSSTSDITRLAGAG